MTRKAPPATLMGLVVALIVPAGLTLVATLSSHGTLSPGHVALGLLLRWLNLALLVAIIALAERRGADSIGVRRLKWWTLPLGLIAGLVITMASPLIATLMSALSLPQAGGALRSMFALSVPFRVALAVTAGIYEETLFRGYGLERLSEILGNRWLAAILSVVAFTLAHWSYWGLAQLLPIFLVGVLVTLLYLWKRNLVVNIVAHCTTDAVGLLLAPLLH